MTKRYEWRDGGSHKVDAEAAVVELNRIKKRNGGTLTPQIVVEASKPKSAVLHAEFEWDDGKAGDAWRTHQARNLIRAPRVVYEEGKGAPVFVNTRVTNDDRMERAYIAAEDAAKSADLFTSALTILLEKVAQARKAAEEFQALAAHERPNEKERLARISVALKALDTAEAALRN